MNFKYFIGLFQETKVPAVTNEIGMDTESPVLPAAKEYEECPDEQSSVDVLEKMTRRLFECSYCNERFPSTQILEEHTQMHLDKTDENMSDFDSKQKSYSLSNIPKDMNFPNEHPDILKRVVRICLKRVDTTDGSVRETNTHENTVKSLQKESPQNQNSKHKKGILSKTKILCLPPTVLLTSN